MQGKTINGFVLKHLLGTGGMAEVWYAENSIGKKAAVKMLLPKLCEDANVVNRFITEAKITVGLSHPYIRQVYDYGEIDGRPTIVQEYLEGKDMKSMMNSKVIYSEYDIEKWWNQLVDALNYTHKNGIIHRDIKPANIFIETNGNVKLLDFGIAKIRESISSTQTGQKIGTLMYMSPEQVKDSKHIDYRTDIYSLAVTFVHLITKCKPYDINNSSDFEISESIVYKKLDITDVPTNWRNFLEPYLAKDPQQRPNLVPFGNKQAILPTPDFTIDTQNDDDETHLNAVQIEKTDVTDPQKATPKKNNRILIILLLLLTGIFAVAIWYIVNRSNDYSQNITEGKTNVEENSIDQILKEKVYEWNKAHNTKDFNVFRNLYNDNVHFYTKNTYSKSDCIKDKQNILTNNNTFYQQIISEIDIEKINNNEFKCSFIKRATSNGKTLDYPSYIHFKKVGNDWKISVESDLITDKNHARRAQK